VNASEKSPIYFEPIVALTAPPATAAPIVCAAVLTIRITAIGLSISCFSDWQTCPIRGFFWRSSASWLGVMLRSAASISEQTCDRTIATAMDPKNRNHSSNVFSLPPDSG